MKKCISLSEYGKIFSTRPKATEVAESIITKTKPMGNKDNLLIDFSGIEALSYSFADELIRGLTARSDRPEFQPGRIAFSGISDQVLSVLNSVLTRRDFGKLKSNRENLEGCTKQELVKV